MVEEADAVVAEAAEDNAITVKVIGELLIPDKAALTLAVKSTGRLDAPKEIYGDSSVRQRPQGILAFNIKHTMQAFVTSVYSILKCSLLNRTKLLLHSLLVYCYRFSTRGNVIKFAVHCKGGVSCNGLCTGSYRDICSGNEGDVIAAICGHGKGYHFSDIWRR